jgi:hypothetical protein
LIQKRSNHGGMAKGENLFNHDEHGKKREIAFRPSS